MAESFLSTLTALSFSFPKSCLQLYCREPVSACFYKEELHSIFPSISEYSQTTLFFVEARIVKNSVSLEKKEQFCKVLIKIFKILEHSFLSEHFQKSISSRVVSPVVGCRL